MDEKKQAKRCQASDIARTRLESYLAEEFGRGNAWDEAIWEFYDFLLEQAKNHRIDCSGFRPSAYKDDMATAEQVNDAARAAEAAARLGGT